MSIVGERGTKRVRENRTNKNDNQIHLNKSDCKCDVKRISERPSDIGWV